MKTKNRVFRFFLHLVFIGLAVNGAAQGVDCGSCSEGTPCAEQQCQFCNLETETCEDCCNQPVFACESPCVIEEGQCRNFSGDTCNLIPEIPSDTRRYLPGLVAGLLIAVIAWFSLKKRKLKPS